MLRRAATAALVLSVVARAAAADPQPADPGSSATTAPAPAPAPAPVPAPTPAPGTAAGTPGPTDPAVMLDVEPPPVDHRALSLGVLGGAYVGVAAWMYVAWYYNKPTIPSWKFGGDGWLGDGTYAGGEDKFGHAWGDYTFARLGTQLLRHEGWSPLTASIISSSLSFTAFFFVEVKDGFFYEFSPSDLTGDAVGSVLALIMDNFPAIDDAFDYRVEWFPSVAFRRAPSSDFVEDYSGERFMLAYKPRSIRAVRESDGLLRYVQYIDPVIGFESRNYKPTPPPGDSVPRRQEIFIGVSLDMQAVFDDLLGRAHGHAAKTARGVTHTVFEFANLPFTSTPVVSYNHSPDEMDYWGAFR